MPTYAIETDAAGAAIGCGFWSEESAPIPTGYSLCTAEQYAAAKSALRNSLAVQATGLLVSIQAEASLAVAMGQTFGPEMRAYVAAMQNIASGADTTSTALPAAPAAVTS